MIPNTELLTFEPPELLITRFCQDFNVSETEAKERFEETKRFLILCAANPGESYTPSEKIDDLWHQFILDTRSYFDFCNKAGAFVHHVPSKEPEREAYIRTIRDLELIFGELNPKYWLAVGDNDGHCGHCTGCGSSIH